MSKKTSKVPIKPLQDKVIIVEFEEKDNKTATGIILPNKNEDGKDTKRGEVVAVGEGRLIDGVLQKPGVSVGDKVLFSWGDEVTVDDQKYIIVNSENISAIIR